MREERRAWSLLEPERSGDRHHGSASGVDGLDDFGVVDALKVDRGNAEVAVAELSLHHDQWDSFVSHLNGVRVRS